MLLYVSPILLFTSLEWTQREINMLSGRSVNSLHPIFTGVEVQRLLSCYCLHLPHPSLDFCLGQVTLSLSLLSDIFPLFLPRLSPIRVARSLIDVEPNGSWKRPFSPGCWHCCSDKMMKLLVGDKSRQRG